MDTQIEVGQIWNDKRERQVVIKAVGYKGVIIYTQRFGTTTRDRSYPRTRHNARMFLRRFRLVQPASAEGG